LKKTKFLLISLVLNTAYLEYGIAQARRGWATKNDIINAWSLEKMLKFLKSGCPKKKSKEVKIIISKLSTSPFNVNFYYRDILLKRSLSR
jgi:hypothetical protein